MKTIAAVCTLALLSGAAVPVGLSVVRGGEAAPKPAPESNAKVPILDLLWQAKTDAAPDAEVLLLLGRNGFAVLRNAAEEKVFMDRLEQAKVRHWDYQVRIGCTFAKDQKVVCWRDITQADNLKIAGAEKLANGLRLLLEVQHGRALANPPAWKVCCFWIPRADHLEVPGPGKDELWTADAKGGDVADGLQACLEVKQRQINPDEDITLTMSLRNVRPADGSHSIRVWDNKYSNGYRADFYLVVAPDGQSRILRQPEQREVAKNVPTPIGIQPGKSWTLSGAANDVIVKSLKALGLDTSKKGIYTITGYYEANGYQGDEVEQAVLFWGGQIATPPVEVRVGEGDFKAPDPDKIKAPEQERKMQPAPPAQDPKVTPPQPAAPANDF